MTIRMFFAILAVLSFLFGIGFVLVAWQIMAVAYDLQQILPPPLTREIVKHYCDHEWAVHLDDVMIRRTGWHYYLAETQKHPEQVADWMGEFLDWPATVRAPRFKTR